MKTITLLIICMTILTINNCFTQFYVGDKWETFNEGLDIIIDSTGNYYLLGKNDPLHSQNIAIKKINDKGMQTGFFDFPNDSTEYGVRLLLTSENEIVIYGETHRNGKFELLIIKCDTSGKEIYNKSFGDTLRTNWLEDAALDKHDDLYAIGTVDTSKEYLKRRTNWALTKVSVNGDSLFYKVFSDGSKIADKILCVHDSLFIVGREHDTVTHYSYPSMYLLDKSGNLIWKKIIDTTFNQGFVDFEYSEYQNCFFGYCIVDDFNIENNERMRLYKLNLKGDTLWSKKIQGFDGGITLNKEKIIIISENFQCFYMDEDHSGSSCRSDSLFFYVYNFDGNLIRKEAINLIGTEFVNKIICSNDGEYVFTGWLFVDRSYGYCYIAKVDENGNLSNISELKSDNTFTVYPTLFTNTISIKNTSTTDNSDFVIKIYDIKGQLCFEERATIPDSGVLNLNLSHLCKGSYIYLIQSTEEGCIGKIIKE